MLDIFLRITDIIFPPDPTVLKIRHETPEDFLRFFSPSIFSNCFVLSDYNQETLKSAINSNKFYNNKHAAKLLAKLLEHWLLTIPTQTIIFVPIPLSPKRERERGYNQVSRVVNNLKSHPKIYVKNLLIRTKETVPQTKLNRKQRLSNLNNVFAFKKPRRKIPDGLIVIIDDVVTTGTTLREAEKTLRENLPEDYEIICLALAH